MEIVVILILINLTTQIHYIQRFTVLDITLREILLFIKQSYRALRPIIKQEDSKILGVQIVFL